jgi:hypothetical protein
MLVGVGERVEVGDCCGLLWLIASLAKLFDERD